MNRPGTSNGRPLRITEAGAFAALLGYAIWLILPMAWVAYSSLKTDEAVFRHPLALPAAGTMATENYARAWGQAHFGGYLLDSVLVTSASVVLILGLGAAAAYALARFSHPLGRLAFGVMIAGLTVPAQLAIVPLFFELRSLRLLDSLPGLVLVYAANGLPFAVFVLAGFFRTLPRSLYEAAVVDGCGEVSAFWKVLLPLARPGLVTVAIFQFIGIWKEYFYAFMLLNGGNEGSPRTLPLGLANLSIAAEYRTEYGMLFAGIVLVTLPILAVYLALQRQIVRGIAAGALKG
jgi:ABC-type glycerol-3-phosphate transport system permease component